MDITTLVREVGLPVALVIYFVWRDSRREERMSARISSLEIEMRGILTDLVRKTTEALINNAAANQRLITMLETQPCLLNRFPKFLEELENATRK